MYIVRINFSKDLLESYAAITDWLYGQTLSEFYVPGNEVPQMSPLIKEEFSDKRFKKTENDTSYLSVLSWIVACN